MRSYPRHAVWIVAAAGFLAMASGLTLQLHLANVQDPDHHGSTHCALCEAILLGAMKLHLDPPSALVGTGDFFLLLPESGVVLPHPRTPVVLAPRPPPIGTV